MGLQVAEKARPIFKTGHRFYGLHGGRGSTKSHAFATKGIVRMLERKFRLLCCREVQRSIADSVHQLLVNKIVEGGVRDHFEITESYIRGPNESVALFRGLQNHTAASVKSMEDLDAAWIEEAQTVSSKSLDLLIPTIRAEGSEIWAGWNPGDQRDPIEFLRGYGPLPLGVQPSGVPPDSALVIELNWRDNPWFPEVLRKDMLRDYARDPDKAAWIWGGEWMHASEARIFRNYRVEDLGEPEGVVWFYGVDWGFSVDPLAGNRLCFPDAQTIYITHEVNEVGCSMERQPPTLLAGLPGLDRWPSSADSARPDIIDYARRHGIPRLRPATKGPGSVEDGITFLQSFDIVLHPRCTATLNEFNRYSYKRDKQTEEILPVVEDAWNHNIDAIRYAVERAHRKGKLIPGIVKTEKKQPDYGFRPFDEGGDDSWKVA